jgi:16S rRNA (cytidine1402-2'-O)-methyltransferase
MTPFGSLFVVATPIGNLEDITLRALRVLGEVSAIACEDTRQALKLLNKYQIHKELISFYQPRERQKIPLILSILKAGKGVALISDSGTPGISDPGFRLVREAINEGIRVVPIPGPTALAAALCASGLATHRFLFLGFPPPKAEAARKKLRALKSEEGTLIFYVPARKIYSFLMLAAEILGRRRVVIAREMTKIFEEFLRAGIPDIIELIDKKKIKGEVVVLIDGAGK